MLPKVYKTKVKTKIAFSTFILYCNICGLGRMCLANIIDQAILRSQTCCGDFFYMQKDCNRQTINLVPQSLFGALHHTKNSSILKLQFFSSQYFVTILKPFFPNGFLLCASPQSTFYNLQMSAESSLTLLIIQAAKSSFLTFSINLF